MRGLILSGPRRVEFRADLPDPAIEDAGDAVVAVGLAGICGSDLHPYEGREAVAFGVIPGHEASGEVVAVGDAVAGFQPGDRVFLPFSTSCGECPACRGGLSARCSRGRLFGWAPPKGVPGGGLSGTQAEFVRVPLADTTLFGLPPGRSDVEGVLLGDNFTTGYYCARQAFTADEAQPRRGGTTVVLGCGAVGLSALVSALHMGAGPVLVVDPVETRRAAAVRLGASRAVGPEEALAACRDLVADAGAAMPGSDVVLEAVGSREARRLALDLAGPGATISSVGVPAGDFGFLPSDLYDRNLTWRVGRCPVRSLLADVLTALDDGLRIPVLELAPEAPLSLEQGPAAYARFAARSDGGLKPMLAP